MAGAQVHHMSHNPTMPGSFHTEEEEREYEAGVVDAAAGSNANADDGALGLGARMKKLVVG